MLFAAMLVLLLPSCDDNGKLYNSNLLIGKWQLYASASANEQWWTYDEEDPLLSIEFFGIDSTNYFTLKGTYLAIEENGTLDVYLDIEDSQYNRRHEVLRADSTELWLKEIVEDGYLKMKFKRK